jgi:RNA 3'-terminal phosphate cyclase (ATP)
VRSLDGSIGEGGGQILRTALALSLSCGEPFRMEKIRAGRAKPGLMRQHLAAVRAAAELGGASVEGDALGSTDLVFRPGRVRGGDYHFAIGTAGSASLVLQTILPPLLFAEQPSRIVIEGGTHNPLAPPFEFLEGAFLPLLRRMGARASIALERYGFYPAGGGRLRAEITPSALAGLELVERGAILGRSATAIISALSGEIAIRELARVRERLSGLGEEHCRIHGVRDPVGPGNVLSIRVESEEVVEVFTSFGERGVSAEAVADLASDEVLAYEASGVPIGPRLADQLLLPLALAGGGVIRTAELSSHCRTQIDLLRTFFGAVISVVEEGSRAVRIELQARDLPHVVLRRI